MSVEPQEFLDKHGTVIQARDLLRLDYFTRSRERPGNRRVVINGHSGNEGIQDDEGGYLDPVPQWTTYLVAWSGACLVAFRQQSSCGLHMEEAFDAHGNPISVSAGQYFLLPTFASEEYLIVNRFPSTQETHP